MSCLSSILSSIIILFKFYYSQEFTFSRIIFPSAMKSPIGLITLPLLSVMLMFFVSHKTARAVSNCRCLRDIPLVITNTYECCKTDHGTMKGVYCNLKASNGNAEDRFKACCNQSPTTLVADGICNEH
ncbi:hypothetical protein BDB00DRAFT_100123 [Zychaea mexicana]|uniref:uncharacterized protein n=1 Tax=Zychaea mexicana TaxID=64656 RepID=UPI0022FE2998|nr:uncharacterized protein BDB00DRAFT_100123 [Zychaea mexicana]KAI9496617.1 hypothetical protein BDB00DRAFT_100123 [Zychaea mexicana]